MSLCNAMPYRLIDGTGGWLVQVQRGGVRRTRRGRGGEVEAKRAEAALFAELNGQHKVEEAARLLGIEVPRPDKTATPTFRDFYERRWLEHAKVVQNATTRRSQRNAFNYLLYFVGDKPLAVLLPVSAVNSFVERMKTVGPMTFAIRKDGRPWSRRCDEFSNDTINKCLQCLRALLNLAYVEGVVPSAPKIDLLPTDDSSPVLPPAEEEFQALLVSCERYREVAPLLPEVVEFVAETGLRRGEVFHLSWGSVDLVRDAVRIEMQAKGRLVNGRPWRPKCNKWREIPLSTRARAILCQLSARGFHRPEELVFENRGGAPYERMDGAPTGAGHGWFPNAVEAAGLKGRVTFHSLRHLFAVRLLTRNVPVTVVSELLGHSNIQITVKRYGRFASDARVKWEAMKVLDETSAVRTRAPRQLSVVREP